MLGFKLKHKYKSWLVHYLPPNIYHPMSLNN